MRQVPLEVFVFIGTFLEELISPIPSFLIMVPAGAAALTQGHPLWYLPVLAVIASCGRLIAGSFLYFVADKLEDKIFAKNRKFFGITHQDVEGFGKKISRKNKTRNWLILFGLAAIPFLPTATLSLACGFVKVKFSTFFTTNFFGSIINGLFFLYIGYVGLESAKIINKLNFAGQILTIIIVAILLVFITRYYISHKKPH
jgi:membrane protein DedA with SNARE-associated domain